MSISGLFLYGEIIPPSLIFMLVAMVGFKYKAYKAIKVGFFIIMLVSPFRYYSHPMCLRTFVSLPFASIAILYHTNSDSLTLIHFVTHGIALYFKGLNSVTDAIKNQSPEEIAENITLTTYYTLITTLVTLMSLKVYNSYNFTLVRKMSTLKDSLAQANDLLNEQNTKLQDSLELKEVFIYTFSHELKNTLNGLLGNLTLAYDAAKNSPVMGFLSSAKVCGEVLKNFVHNILDSGKLENGHLEASCEKRDVMSLLENMWSLCGYITHNKRLEGYLEIEKDVPRYLELDEQRMIQIMLNLTSNAVKFTEKGRVHFRVSWQTTSATPFCNIRDREQQHHHPEEPIARVFNYEEHNQRLHTPFQIDVNIEEFPNVLEDSPSLKSNQHLITVYPKRFINKSTVYQLNAYKSHWQKDEVLTEKFPHGSYGTLKIQVIDTGCGIPVDKQALLFQKFSQVHDTAGQRKIGTGLGLWICKELAKRLNGDIKVRSNVDIGSMFEFTTSTRVSQSSESNFGALNFEHDHSIHPTKLSSLIPFQLSGQQKKTLIADDDSFNLELLKNYLDKLGVSYLCAYDGEEAVSLFKKSYQDICFVITDNFMPKKTGTEAAEEMASFLRDKGLPKIPILCVSGDVKVNVGRYGITSVIQKPINFDRLTKELFSAYSKVSN